MTESSKKTTLEKGREVVAKLAPRMEKVLAERYDELLPGMSETLVEFGYGRMFSRPGLDIKSRYIATIACLATLGGQTREELKYNVMAALRVGLTKEEIAEAIFQCTIHGGATAAINGLDAAKEAFEAQGV
ncbi:MAG: carboxymuconolactone decarboxylase family protein [Pseudomonadota bacterium]